MKITIICFLFATGIFSSFCNAEMMVRLPNCDRYLSIGCSKILDPVCGTDQVTYSNECILCLKNKITDRRIKIQKNGRC